MCVYVCSDLLLHQHAAFVRLLLVYLVDFVPLSLVETLQSDTENRCLWNLEQCTIVTSF